MFNENNPLMGWGQPQQQQQGQSWLNNYQPQMSQFGQMDQMSQAQSLLQRIFGMNQSSGIQSGQAMPPGQMGLPMMGRTPGANPAMMLRNMGSQIQPPASPYTGSAGPGLNPTRPNSLNSGYRY